MKYMASSQMGNRWGPLTQKTGFLSKIANVSGCREFYFPTLVPLSYYSHCSVSCFSAFFKNLSYNWKLSLVF